MGLAQWDIRMCPKAVTRRRLHRSRNRVESSHTHTHTCAYLDTEGVKEGHSCPRLDRGRQLNEPPAASLVGLMCLQVT